ncbi:uncharacterized protein EV420DRAFT_1652251 [Desarmillaria tabescens]|uniref:Uncharacterized protein n=1 Tax=Armillaria tabescens TaxID=1929756 RepID=A0AA39J6D5_ARMTA|nr:uncharacterized protein EV420DRAFT_1652251 [Desarmillaria tabescens]KAK0436972.1 hypothetical protein EV420DRAFT_1652251 [Desarmillaria tabescens]
MEMLPNSTGYLWIPEHVVFTATEAAVQLQRYYPNIHWYIREVRYCGGSVKRTDVEGLKRLFAQLPLAKSFILEGISRDIEGSGILNPLAGPLHKIEHLSFSGGIIYAEDLNKLLPGKNTYYVTAYAFFTHICYQGMSHLTKITVSPSTVLEIEAGSLTPKALGMLAHLRFLDLSMPEMDDDFELEDSYEWIQTVPFPAVCELHIHSYCQWWCTRACFIMDALASSTIDRLALDVYCTFLSSFFFFLDVAI